MPKTGRKILLITTDQQRFDALGCNGGRIARTPVVDGLAESGINYQRAHNQSVVCMPARSTMVTGQYVRSHGVWMNGVPLPAEAPSIAAHLHNAGYRTALIGKAHFEPAFDPKGEWTEGRMAREGSTGPYRGFERAELVMHGPVGFGHYPKYMTENHQEHVGGFYRQVGFDSEGNLEVNHRGGGDTGACQVHHNPVPREIYHTDWVADRTLAFLDGLDPEEDWFVWMSFPDPHHPWDPPASEISRCNWRDLDLPDGYPGNPEACREILGRKPHHWLDWFDGRAEHLNVEAPPGFVPARLTPDQIREVNAMTHIENELIDEACGRVLGRIEERDWTDATDVFFTSDHGELQGDFGLLFKGPYHVDALMRVPLIWRPAPSASVKPARVEEPVGHIDLASTFCAVAGVEVPDWNQGRPLPTAAGSDRESVLTEWDCVHRGVSTRIRSIYRDGILCSAYEKSSIYEGHEGEFYDLRNDPLQFENRWDEASAQGLKKDLIAELYAELPSEPKERPAWRAPV
jgi:arylsulfatase A-like enzyme